MTSALPFDDIRALLKDLPPPHAESMAAASQWDQRHTEPPGSTGLLATLATFLSGWQARHPPAMTRPVIAVFAGSHGVAHGATGPDSADLLARLQSDTSAVNQICRVQGLGLKAFELALEIPTRDITREAALEEDACAATMAYGMEAVAGGCDLLAVAEVGQGGTLAAAALCHGLYGGRAGDWVVATGDKGLDAVATARVGSAVERHQSHLADPLEAMRRLGGRELAAMAGAILAARLQGVPVLLDGYGAAAAAAVLHRLAPAAIGHCLAAQRSGEAAHDAVLARIGKVPLLSLGITAGDGLGSALASGVVKAAIALHAGSPSATGPVN
jgi:nicotinate-nucleotide--dimethylbenzimidazole phosphoribosyltransferase